jgi:hypothetical protein
VRIDERGRIGLWFYDFAAGRYPDKQETLLFGIEGALTAEESASASRSCGLLPPMM